MGNKLQEIYQVLGRAGRMEAKLKFLLPSVTEESHDPVGGDGDGYRNPRFGLKGSMGGNLHTFTPVRLNFMQLFILALTLISTAGHLISHPLFIHIFSQSHLFTPPLNINKRFLALFPKVLNFPFAVQLIFFSCLFDCVLPDLAAGQIVVLQSDPAFLKCSGGDVTQFYDACACVWLTSLRRDAQQVCLIFHTTAATRSSDRKQLERKRVNVNADSP